MVVDPSVLQATLVGHTDAIWGLSMHNSKMHLLSCSSDATVRLWNPNIKSPLLSTFRIDTGILPLFSFCMSRLIISLLITFAEMVVACAEVSM